MMRRRAKINPMRPFVQAARQRLMKRSGVVKDKLGLGLGSVPTPSIMAVVGRIEHKLPRIEEIKPETEMIASVMTAVETDTDVLEYPAEPIKTIEEPEQEEKPKFVKKRKRKTQKS